MCDVPSTAFFVVNLLNLWYGMASTFFIKPFVTISVALIITGITIHCKVHIRCISIHNPFTLVSFCFLLRDISVCTYCHICQYACILLLLLLWGKQNIYCYEDAQAVPSRPSSKGTRKQGKAFGVEI